MTALFLHQQLVVQSTRRATCGAVDWVQSAAMLVRREAAAEIGYFDPQFFVYSDEVDFCRRLADAGWHTLYVPGARAVHHEQLSTGNVPTRRIVEFSRNRDRYMRKHHSARLGRARALPDGLHLRAARRGRARPARARPEALRQARHARRCSRAAAKGSPRPPRVQPPVEGTARLSSRARGEQLARAEEAREVQRGRDRRQRERAGDEARDAVGGQQQLARGRDPAGDEREAAPAGPTRTRPGTGCGSARTSRRASRRRRPPAPARRRRSPAAGRAARAARR